VVTRGGCRGCESQVIGPFAFEVMFSFKGKAFFVDLSQGILWFDLPAAADSPVGDFDFIYLPVPCEPNQSGGWWASEH
jgi:hypothetical protein